MFKNYFYEDENPNYFLKGESIFGYENENNKNPLDISLLSIQSKLNYPENDFQEKLIAEISTKAQLPDLLFKYGKMDNLFSPIPGNNQDDFFLYNNPENELNFKIPEIENKKIPEIENSKFLEIPKIPEIEAQKIPEIKKDEYNFTSKKTQLFSIKGEKRENRIDYLIKSLKKYSSECMINMINEMIKKHFPGKANQLSKPNTSLYTSITKISTNVKFMSMSIKDILTIGKNTPKCSRQTRNGKIIDNLEKNEVKEIKEFLEMKLKDFYENIFFDSKEFKEFCNDERNKVIDKEFIRQRNYSLMEKNGYLRYLFNRS